jgi:hypothetical protein
LHFSLPGLMSLLSLVDPASTALWRISLRSSPPGRPGPGPGARSGATGLGAAAYAAAYRAAMILYVLIARGAVVHSSVADIGVLALPLRVEAVLQTILVFLG